MKLPALLKDSLREALDRKIFAAMLILGGLLTLVVASISYRPITVEEEVQAAARQWQFLTGMHQDTGKPTYAIEGFSQTNASTEPWRGDYQFVWTVTAKDADSLKHLPFTTRDQVRAEVKSKLGFLTNVEVSDNQSKDPKQVQFTVTSRGTTADDFLGWRYEPKILFAIPLPFVHTSVRNAVYFIEDTLVNGFGAWVAVLIGVIITASFIPNMLQKGAVELWLAKPINRPLLLICKYIGGLAFVFLITTATVLAVWITIGLRSGLWTTGFLIVIPAVTFYFALLYSVSTLAALVTRSTVVAILCTLAVWFGLWVNGTVHAVFDAIRTRSTAAQKTSEPAGGEEQAEVEVDAGPPAPGGLPEWAYTISDVFYKVLPRTRELNDLTAVYVGRGLLNDADEKKLEKVDRPPWWETVGVTTAFIAIMLGLASWKFARTDY